MSDNRFGINKRKNKTLPAIIASAAVTVVCIIIVAAVFFRLGSDDKIGAGAEGNDVQTGIVTGTEGAYEVSDFEMRGMWIASTINIDYPSSKGKSRAELEKELDSIVERAENLGINTVFFQVRPCADALYDSDIFPQSVYVSGEQGMSVDGFDSLGYLLRAAGSKNIDVHAWVNPYRVTMYESDEAQLCEESPAVIHPEYTVKYADGKTYFDPGIPEVRELVVSGVKELAEKYPDLAGIHFDDYFYPYPYGTEEFDDSKSYEKYADGMDKADWRRENVNILVKQTYEAVKSINEDIDFGVSVFGIWANESSDTPVKGSNTNGLEAYSALYCDALAWAKGGYVDYIAPQNYWHVGNLAASFDDVARWWNANLDGTGVDLYMGHAAYKSGDYPEGEIYRQVEMCRALKNYKGSIFYGYGNIKNNVSDVADDIKRLYEEKHERQEAVSDGEQISINFPEDNSYVNASRTYILGSCDPAFTLYFNGNPVSVTRGGYFSEYVTLEEGKNVFEFTQNGKTKLLCVNYGVKNSNPASGSSYKTMSKMEITNPNPSGGTWLDKGEKLEVACTAPAGSVVTAVIGGMEIVLSPTINPPDESEYMYERYVGSITPSDFAKEGEIKALGTLTFNAERGSEKASLKCGLISQKGDSAYSYAEVVEDYTHTKVGTNTSFYDDFLPSSKGMRDYITDMTAGFYKLRFGGFISEDKLSVTYGKPLLLNTILTTAIEVVCTDDTNNKCNTTDIRFGVTENIPVDVDFRGENGGMRIIIYNSDTSIIPEFTVPENPLIKSIVGAKGTREGMIIYTVTLKNKENFYGFNIVYENGCMIVKLNNPQRLKDGDKPLEGKRIVVDAGHGGNDIGAPGPGKIPEAELNRRIASQLVAILKDMGAEVIESRKNNETVDLYERMDILNAECPDLAISVHHNSVAGSSNALKAKGFLALYSNNSGISLAKTVSFVVSQRLGREEKPTAYQQLAVARNHRFPSALLEMCFISNVEEYQWSINEGNDRKSAEAVAEGILQYYRNQEKYLDY